MLSNTVRLTRLGWDPRTTVTIDLPVAELVLVSGLCEVAYQLSQNTREMLLPEPGSVVAPTGPHRTLDMLSTRVYVALRRHALHQPTLQQPRPVPDAGSVPGGVR